jgi:hypothetical protein
MVVAKYDLGVFVEPDNFEEILKGASKFVPNSATEQPATRYQLPAIPPLLGNVMNGKFLGRKCQESAWALGLKSLRRRHYY